MAAPDQELTDVVAGPPRRRAWKVVGRVILAAIVVTLVAMWAGIFLGFFDKTAPGTLDDATFAERAAPVCAATKAQLDELPKAFQTNDHVERAHVVAQSNVLLRDMVAQLATFAPTQERDGQMSQEWLRDWSTYIDNRDDYVARLTADESARFYESTKSSDTEQISKPIDRFAYVNDMDACDTPQDMS
jgi:hypothetical protein